MMNAAAAASATANTADGAPRVERRKRLSAAALAVANRKVPSAFSTIVITGAVRAIDFVLLSAIGIVLYLTYVRPLDGFSFSWEYIEAILLIALVAVISFQAADIYDLQVFRGQLRQMTRIISSW